MIDIATAVHGATQELAAAGVETARLDAEILLCQALEVERTQVVRDGKQPLSPHQEEAFAAMIQRRLRGEPVAYIRGVREFWGLPLEVDRRVLIPRPDTETLVEAVLGLVAAAAAKGSKVSPGAMLEEISRHAEDSPGAVASSEGMAILELGTGSGAVACALAQAGCRVTAADISVAALQVARKNIFKLRLCERVRLVVSDLFANITARFAIIAANLPYVTDAEYAAMPGGIRDYEPPLALRGGEDGLDVIRRAIAAAPEFLLPGGWFALEVGCTQAEAVMAMLLAAGYRGVISIRDLAGLPRVVLGIAPAV